MKTIKMDYSEYEKMIKTIKAQQEAIDAFNNDSRVVLLDYRYMYWEGFDSVYGSVPTIISDEKLIKEYLQEEFDKLSGMFKNMNEDFKSEVENEKPKDSWWAKILKL
jgi:hypothetical protein